MHYIYVIQHIGNLKVYIGQTENPRVRFAEHRRQAKLAAPKMVIGRAIKKYGVDAFTLKILEEHVFQAETDEAESLWIERFQSRNRQFGYNVKPGGRSVSGPDHPSFGKPRSEATKEKLRQANYARGFIGEKHPWFGCKHTPEALQKMIANNPNKRGINGMRGKKHSEETKEHWSLIRKGRPSPKTRTISDETIALVREEFARTSNYMQVARLFDIGETTCHRIIKRKGRFAN